MVTQTQILIVQNIPISVTSIRENDFICITDRTKAKIGEARAADIIGNRAALFKLRR